MLSQETVDTLHEIQQRLEEEVYKHKNGFYIDGIFRAIDEIERYFNEQN